MRVKIRLGQGPAVKKKQDSKGSLALAFSALLTPAALMACVLALWRLGADLNWTGEFAISSGLFSHWQVWIAMAVVLRLSAAILNRYGHARLPPPPGE